MNQTRLQKQARLAHQNGLGHTANFRSSNQKLEDIAHSRLNGHLAAKPDVPSTATFTSNQKNEDQPVSEVEVVHTHKLANGNAYADLFAKVYDEIELEFDFDPEWANGTGYFDNLMSANLGVGSGTMATTKDLDGRRIIVIVTCLGNVVLFERYKPGQTFAVVGHCPLPLKPFVEVGQGAVNYDTFRQVTGAGGSKNVGKSLDVLRKTLAELG